jgi:DNA topoisomerase-1
MRCAARQGARRGPGTRRHSRGKASEKLVEAIDRLDEKIKAFKLQMVDQEAEKKVTLSMI